MVNIISELMAMGIGSGDYLLFCWKVQSRQTVICNVTELSVKRLHINFKVLRCYILSGTVSLVVLVVLRLSAT